MAFDLQGHRGARGLKPENTLPSFEIALDSGVTSIETDLHLSRDGVAVLIHDHELGEKIFQPIRLNPQKPWKKPLVNGLTLSQLRCYRGDLNPDPGRFPDQNVALTPLARLFAESQGMDPYGIPTLEDLIAFAAAYAGEPGQQAGKTAGQRERAARVRFDLELKRVSYRPERIGDSFNGDQAGLLEERVVEVIRRAGVVTRTTVRSFDHRCVRAIRRLEPGLTTAVLVANTTPVDPVQLAISAEAAVYCPDFQFLDEVQVRYLKAGGIRVLPWTVNEPADWRRLLDWGVDGITTDFPDRLANFLSSPDSPCRNQPHE